MTHPTQNLELAPPAPSVWMLAGNKGFPTTTEQLDDTLAEYSEPQREALRFWWDMAKDKGWSQSILAKQCGISSTVLSRVYSGKYNAEIGSMIEKLERARANFAEVVDNPDFILTSLAKRMFQVFDKTRAMRCVTIMWGIKGIGKTTIEEEYQRRNNHGKTFYVRCPGHGCTLHQFVSHVAKSMRINHTSTTMAMRDKIALYLARGSRLLIIDELHEIFLTCVPREAIRICEFLREVYDVSGCGLALTGTDALHKEFFSGAHKDVLSQLVDRGTVQIQLPKQPSKSDVLAFLAHYGLAFPGPHESDAAALLNDIIASNGLRKLTLHLRDGASYASRINDTYAWCHFVAAHQAIQSLSK